MSLNAVSSSFSPVNKRKSPNELSFSELNDGKVQKVSKGLFSSDLSSDKLDLFKESCTSASSDCKRSLEDQKATESFLDCFSFAEDLEGFDLGREVHSPVVDKAIGSSSSARVWPQSCSVVSVGKGRIKEISESSAYQFNGEIIDFIPFINKGKQVQGEHSLAYTIDPSSPRCFPEIPNEDLIVKIPKSKASIKTDYADALKQHDLLKKNLKVPIAEILNRTTCIKDGFFIQKKVRPFEKAPWRDDQSLEEIQRDPELNNYLNQMTEHFIYTLLDTSHPGLDLRWSNFGVALEESSSLQKTLVLFDFFELDDEFYLIAKDALYLISGGNIEVCDYILSCLPKDLINIPKWTIESLKKLPQEILEEKLQGK